MHSPSSRLVLPRCAVRCRASRNGTGIFASRKGAKAQRGRWGFLRKAGKQEETGFGRGIFACCPLRLGIFLKNGGLSLLPRGVFSVGAVKMGVFPAEKVIFSAHGVSPTAHGVSPTAHGVSPTTNGVGLSNKSADWLRGGWSESAKKISHFVKDRIQRAVFPPSPRGRFSPEHQTNNKTRNLTTKQNSNITNHNIHH